jgi:glutaconate CoA-transferase subunit A
VARRSKLVGLTAAAELVADGDHVALGGIWSHNAPTALVRELLRRPARDLTVSAAPAAGFAVDLLIAGGCVTRAHLPNVTFDHQGLAPAFRRAVESGALELVECDEASLVAGYRAAAAGLPSQPVVSIVGTALAEASRALVPADRDGVTVLEVPPLAPDVVLLHAQEGDVHGNVRHLGSVFADRVLAKAARRAVVVSVDRLVHNEEIRRDPRATTVPSYLVTHVVEAPFGAHPCSSHGEYDIDEDHVRGYVDAVRGDAADWTAYRERFVVGHPTYLEACGLPAELPR